MFGPTTTAITSIPVPPQHLGLIQWVSNFQVFKVFIQKRKPATSITIKIFYCLRAKDLNGPLKLATYLLSTYQVSIRAFEPPIFCHLSGLKLLGQKSKQRCPDLSPPSYLIQVLAVPKLAKRHYLSCVFWFSPGAFSWQDIPKTTPLGGLKEAWSGAWMNSYASFRCVVVWTEIVGSALSSFWMTELTLEDNFRLLESSSFGQHTKLVIVINARACLKAHIQITHNIKAIRLFKP